MVNKYLHIEQICIYIMKMSLAFLHLVNVYKHTYLMHFDICTHARKSLCMPVETPAVEHTQHRAFVFVQVKDKDRE